MITKGFGRLEGPKVFVIMDAPSKSAESIGECRNGS
jgi:hypothetical protein